MLQRMMWSLTAIALSLGCSGSHPANGTPQPHSSAAAGKTKDDKASAARPRTDSSAVKPPGAAPPATPIDGALPDIAPPTLVERVDCGLGQTCTMSHLVPDDLVRGLSARGALVMWEETIA